MSNRNAELAGFPLSRFDNVIVARDAWLVSPAGSVLSQSRVCALVVAGGSSRRMGFDKLTVSLGGLPLLAHTLRAFARCDAVDGIVLVAAPARMQEFEDMARKHAGEKFLQVVAGGAERDASVWNGLRSIGDEFAYVAVHDAARPLIRPSMIARCIAAAREHRAVVCAEPVTDTLQRADEELRIIEHVDRRGLWRMQTPQVFETELLRNCYNRVMAEGKYITDESMAVRLCGHDVFLVENPDWNIKVTYPRDVALVEYLLMHQGPET